MKAPNCGLQHVLATSVEFYGEHLAFRNSQNKLAALFLVEIVESWNEIAFEPIATKPS
jgi:hypothetical protein